MISKIIVDDFLNQKVIAVAGVSRNNSKFGNAVYKELMNKGYKPYPVNPHMAEFLGDKCYPNLKTLPELPGGVVIAVNKDRSLQAAQDAYEAGITRVWFQHGSASDEAISFCLKNKMSVIHHECILMFTEPKGIHKFHRWINSIFGRLPA